MNKHNHDKQVFEQKKRVKYEKKCWYCGIQFSSIFEVEVAKYLDQLNIKWERNEKAFPALMEDGRILHYIPDFIILGYNKPIYLETKGKFFSSFKKDKTYKAVKDNSLNWIIVFLKEWRESKKCVHYKINKLIRDSRLTPVD